MNAQTRSDLIRTRVRADMVTTLRVHLGKHFAPSGEFLDELTENAMHPVDLLLAVEDKPECEHSPNDMTMWKHEGANMYSCKLCGQVGWLVVS
jgi:hypothetical protein